MIARHGSGCGFRGGLIYLLSIPLWPCSMSVSFDLISD